MEVIDFCMAQSFWGNNSFSYTISPSCGALGGILLIQDLDHISYKKTHSSDYFIAIEAVWSSLGLLVLFILVTLLKGLITRDNYGLLFSSLLVLSTEIVF